MQLFFAGHLLQPDLVLGPDESFHAVKVLRMTRGDDIFITDGKGTVFKGIITQSNSKACKVELTEELKEFNRKSYALHVATALTKNRERFEWFVEKATETGITEITPLLSERSTRDRIRTDRIEKIIHSAALQAKVPVFPVLNKVTTFKEFMTIPHQGVRLIAHCNAVNKMALNKSDKSVLMLIGPEGDFTLNEVNEAAQFGFEAVSLGQTVMRVETAALFVCASMRYAHM